MQILNDGDNLAAKTDTGSSGDVRVHVGGMKLTDSTGAGTAATRRTDLTTTAGTIADTPAAGETTAISNISLTNHAAGTRTVTLYKTVNSTTYDATTQWGSPIPLLQGESAEWTPGAGWIIYDANRVAKLAYALQAATAADQETATSASTYVTPAQQHRHPSAAKCFAYVTYSGGVPTLQSVSYNITSITDTGVGNLAITIATDFSSANWAVQATGVGTGATAANMRVASAFSVAAGSVSVGTFDQAATPAVQDPTAISMVGFGDH